MLDYSRTSPDALAASASEPLDVESAQRWRESPHYKMPQTGDSFLRRRLNTTTKDEFPVLSDFLAAGMTDYVAIITRFIPEEGVIGEMDGVYSSWATRLPDGFSDGQIAALQRIAPYLALGPPSPRTKVQQVEVLRHELRGGKSGVAAFQLSVCHCRHNLPDQPHLRPSLDRNRIA